MKDLQELLKLLIHSPLDFVLVGGFAAVLHGSNQTTRDVDICVLYSADQVLLLRNLLQPHHPYHRFSESKESFLETPGDLLRQQDFHLTTDLGSLDIVIHIEGVGGYHDVLQNSEEIEIYGGRCRLISIDDLIKSKRALGRHRDVVVAMELEAIREERNKKSRPKGRLLC